MWQPPKTDWKSNDFFNIQDYNRIKENLKEIQSLAVTLWPDFSLEDMGADKTYQDYGFYADEINKFESNLERICAGTFPFQIGERQTFYENQPFVDWKELNRLESACQTIYQNILGRRNGIPRIQFVLGNRRTIKTERK